MKNRNLLIKLLMVMTLVVLTACGGTSPEPKKQQKVEHTYRTELIQLSNKNFFIEGTLGRIIKQTDTLLEKGHDLTAKDIARYKRTQTDNVTSVLNSMDIPEYSNGTEHYKEYRLKLKEYNNLMRTIQENIDRLGPEAGNAEPLLKEIYLDSLDALGGYMDIIETYGDTENKL